uniref:M protein repeat protein n=1 Tax=Mycena chlorophos TaxID=658473 RepID=A0ABQ0LBB9_MYCCL|nr:predicted protein [Mycena chlorophos]
MATTARATPPVRRTTTSPPAVRGTARSAAVPKTSSPLSPARRASLKTPPDSAAASLKQETEQKEQLLVQVQDKEQTIANLSTENKNLNSALQAAETRLNELYADQSRAEVDLAQRIEISENLRAQVRELEKEKRDIQRRYNDQTTTFEAERQAFFDNEQHLKSRIASLSQARKQPERSAPPPETTDTESIAEVEEEQVPLPEPEPPKQHMDDPESEPAEMTALRLELSTLSTSYTSLQNTLVLLQSQLIDLKRVNNELQEENESYMILLRERTLNGQFDVMKQMGGSLSDDESDDDGTSADRGSLRSAPRSVLDKVEEEEDTEETLEQQLERSLARETDSPSSSRGFGRPARKRTGSHSSQVRGESLADLPITGPGLDLAAELGRAENKDILDGNVVDEQDRSLLNGKKRSKKSSTGRKDGIEASGPLSDLDALKSEVKSLKDANKALSLYASKIIDRIISQEGFEHVLAVDFDKDAPPPTPHTAGPALTTFPSSMPPKPRPQSAIVARSATPGTPVTGLSPSMPPPKLGTPPAPAAKAQRRSMSFDWKGFSLFSGAEKKPDNPSLRPLTLKPGASPVTGARKLETHEDDNDRKERERMNATMKLMGIQPQPSPVFAPSTTPPVPAVAASVPSTPSSRRFSFFTRTPAAPASEPSDTASIHSNGSSGLVGLGIGPPSLTQDVLERAEAENSLAALDAHERTLSAEIAKGSSGGFTEIARRQPGSRRARRSAAGSSGNGSTVWSAGEEEDQ